MSNGPMPPEEDRFQANGVGLAKVAHTKITKLYNLGYKTVNPQLVEVAACLVQGFDKVTLIEGFIRRSHPHWEIIKKKNISFFMDHSDTIFGELPMENVNAFKDLFTLKTDSGEKLLKDSDVKEIWGFLIPMLKICIKYVHKKRGPYSRKGSDGKIHKKYRKKFMPEIDLSKACEGFDAPLVLDFPVLE